MDDHPLADLSPCERTRFSGALRRLLPRGIIKEASGDPTDAAPAN